MISVDPARVFQGTLAVIAPHMDDEVLACGGTLARLPDKRQIHVCYATDGSRSPVPEFRWMGSPSPDLPSIRRQEAEAALAVLGIPPENLHFLGFPDAALRRHAGELRRSLTERITSLRPAHILIPFRYDRHPDHLALHRAAVESWRLAGSRAQVTEYFVYYRWQLLAGGDIRRFVRPDQLVQVDIQGCSAQKKRALECFRSQTTLLYPWQDRPILTRERVEEVSRSAECFVRYDPALPGAAVFTHLQPWIRLVHAVEPLLKQRKDQALRLLRMGTTRDARKAS